MISEVMKALKDGDQVKLVGYRCVNDDLPPIGTILTRKKEWIDDDESVAFTFEVDGVKDYHFFYHDEIELIKE